MVSSSESAYEFNTWNTTNLFRFFDRFTLFFTPRSTSSLIQFLLYVSPSSFFVSKSLFLTFLRANKQSFHSLHFFFFLFESSYIWCESSSSRVSHIEAISFQLFFTLPSTVNNPLLSLQFFFSLFIHSRRLMRCPERFKSLLAVSCPLALPPPELFSLGKRNSLFGISSRRLIGPTSFPLIFYAIWMNKSINGSPTNRRWDPIHVCCIDSLLVVRWLFCISVSASEIT